MKTIKRNPFSMNCRWCSFFVIPCKTSTFMLSHAKHPNPQTYVSMLSAKFRVSVAWECETKHKESNPVCGLHLWTFFFISMFFLHLTNFWWGFEQSGTITLVTFAKHQDGLSPSAKNKVSSAQIHSQICFALSSKIENWILIFA